MKKLLALFLAAVVLLSGTAVATQIQAAPTYDPHNLADFEYRKVSIAPGLGSLVFQTEPGGSFLSDHTFWNGDLIYVNIYWREKGYALAYDNGTYGYVDLTYIDWSPLSSSSSGKTSGASSSSSSGKGYDPHNLSDYAYRTVSIAPGLGTLVFQTEPGGSFLKDHSFSNGDKIYVNIYWREKGYALAYDNGTYGYVDASYIDWGTGSSSSPGSSSGKASSKYDPHNLADFAYRTVSIAPGLGSLVFQTEPGGSFLSDHTFWSGDQIYVNIYWRENGYALAYDNGTYGYVDAGYIDWGTSASSSYNPYNLSEFAYRTVCISPSEGTLVFQTEPAGSFLSDHQFSYGDKIYVNVNYRTKGYALAYDNGTYGYVDASYISW